MDKNLIGWTVVIPGFHGDIRTYFKVDQKAAMRSCLLTYVDDGLHVVRVEPEYGTPRRVLY